MNIQVDQVFRNVGWMQHKFVIPPAQEFWVIGGGTPLVDQNGAVVVARWKETFLELEWTLEHSQGSGAGSTARGAGQKILSNPSEIAQFLLKRFNVRANLEPRIRYRAAEVVPSTRMVWVCWIDTNSSDFCQTCKELVAAGENRLPIEITLMLIIQREGAVQTHRKSIRLELRPICYPPPFTGVMGLDLGNTHTTLAALEAREVLGTKQVRLLPDLAFHVEALNHARLESQTAPIKSFLRIDAISDLRDPQVLGDSSPEEVLANPEAYAYRVGDSVNVLGEGPWGLIANPKRSVTAAPRGFTHVVVARAYPGIPAKAIFDAPIDYQVQLGPTRPAELFICRLLEGFRGVVHAWPRRLVVTYPSTFSATELSRLKEGVFRAWRMAERANEQGPVCAEDVIPLMIDEASAAAFYYLARTVLEGPGGLRSFRWLYPDGFYLLVYDCGGATTDVALVKAEATSHSRLRFVVLGRTGLRDFGGDEVTVAIFLLLKAKLAEKLAKHRARSVPRLPEIRRGDNPRARAADLRAFFSDERNLAAWDEWVPTDFDPHGFGHDAAARQQLTWLIWSWAEECKKFISQSRGGQRLSAPGIFEMIAKILLELNPDLGIESRELAELVGQVMPLREEIDALIWEPVERSIRLCRSLAINKLEWRAGHVDDVFLVGYGSLYPLIRERMRAEFLGDTDSQECHESRPSLFSLESAFSAEDLKNCVAKGAVLALALREATLGLSLEFDTELCRRLPFSVAWHNAATNACVALYAEGERYEELAPKRIEVIASAQGQRPQWIRLLQRWPGADYEPFLLFSFPEGVEGAITIYFDIDREEFIAVSEHTGQQAVGQRDINPDVYRSAVQRGKIRLCGFRE